MAKQIRFATTIMLLLSAIHVWGQASRPVDIDFETKVIYTDSLSLPMHINVGALLRLLPELLQRPDGYTLSHYEVQVDGVSIGESANAVLAVMQLSDIECLEVKNSPTSSDLNGGMSGSINLRMRSMNSKKKNVTGKAALGFSTEWSTMGDFLIDYKKDKLTVRGIMFGENSRVSDTSNMILSESIEMKTAESTRNQLARAMITYKPNHRNELELTLSEAYSYNKEVSDVIKSNNLLTDETLPSTTQCECKALLKAHLNYAYKISDAHSLKLMGQYGYKPSHLWNYNELQERGDTYSNENVAEGAALINGKWKLADGSWSYSAGTKGAISKSNKQLMPLAELTFLYGPFRMKAGAEYQWNEVGINNWSGRLVLGWQMNKSNRVRLLMNRQLRMPDIISKSIGVEYITNMKWNRHRLTMNAGVNHCESKNETNETNYLNANLMAIYQYDIFLLSMTAIFYTHNQDYDFKNQFDYKTYYNISLMPSLNLNNGWRTAMNLRYYSKVHHRDVDLGHCLSLQLNVGKTWDKWSLYAYGRAPLTGRTTNLYKTQNKILSTYLVPASVGCGVSLDF